MVSSGLITILFTDLVGSTELASEVGAAAADELRRAHFADLREAIEATGGTEVKTIGDAVMVSYGGAADALAGAVAMQRAVSRHNRRADAAPIAMRVGISVGDATFEDGDWFGTPVIEAARLCAEADGGQILVSDLVRALAGSRSDFELVSLGTRELKGLPDPVAVCEVVWAPTGSDASAVPLPARLLGERGVGFVGRDAERTVLADALKHAAYESARRVVLIGGEPGIGKTTLTTEAVRAAHDDGAIVLYGRSDEDLGIPYQPWIEALGHLVEHAPDELVTDHVADHGGELTRLVPALAHRRPNIPSPRASDPETERYLLFGAVKGLLHAAGTEAPVVVVLDDLHWADKPTLLLLRHLVSAPEPARLLIIGTFRESEVAAGHALADVLAALHREEGVERLSLRGLEDVELLELMTSRAGHEMDKPGVELAHALRRETDGNPFFVAEILRHLAESGAIFEEGGRWQASADLRASGLPVSVREVIGRRVARLGEQTVRALGVAAVIGRDFDAALVARVADVGDDALLDLLDQAVEARLVEEVPGAPGHYTFAHALTEHALYDDQSASRRARIHRRVAEALEARYGPEPGDHLGELAYHWQEATAPQDAAKAIEYARRAGARALSQLAPDEAVRWYAQGIELLERSALADERLRCELLIGLGDARMQAGVPGSRETLLDAAGVAEQLGDAELLARAAVANSRSGFSDARHADEERVAVLRSALEVVRDAATRARLLALLASELIFAGDYDQRRALSDEAVTLARRSGDNATLAFVLRNRIFAASTHLERSEIIAELRPLLEQLDDPLAAMQLWMATTFQAVERGDTRAAAQSMAVSDEITDRIDGPTWRWLSGSRHSFMALLRGDIDGAERIAEDTLGLGTETAQPDALQFYAAALIAVRWHQGRVAELGPMVAEVVVDTPGIPAFVAQLAHCRLEAGDHAGARALLEVPAADGFASIPFDVVWTSTVALWAEVAVHLEVKEPAPALLELLRPHADLVVFNGSSTFGPIADHLGRLETMLGHFDAAEALFDAAMVIHDRFQAPFFLARTLLHRAELCARRAGAGDADLARELLAETLVIARRHGYAGLERAALAREG